MGICVITVIIMGVLLLRHSFSQFCLLVDLGKSFDRPENARYKYVLIQIVF